MNSKLLIYAMPGNVDMAAGLAAQGPWTVANLETRSFPDGETYLKLIADPGGQSVALVSTLDRPNEKVLPLLFAAATARELGAKRVGLVAPYLAYMRQDRRFQAGEAVTSRPFAQLLSSSFDWLVTVDPHLHRYSTLSEIYTIPARVVHAAPLISQWIKDRVSNPLVIGPDAESEQWVRAVAEDASAPYAVLEKIRKGDRDVEISLRRLDILDGRTPVLVDDIVSSGVTMLQAVRQLRAKSPVPPVCLAVHGIFAEGSDRLLAEAGASVVTCNTIPHSTNAMDVSALLADAMRDLLR